MSTALSQNSLIRYAHATVEVAKASLGEFLKDGSKLHELQSSRSEYRRDAYFEDGIKKIRRFTR